MDELRELSEWKNAQQINSRGSLPSFNFALLVPSLITFVQFTKFT